MQNTNHKSSPQSCNHHGDVRKNVIPNTLGVTKSIAYEIKTYLFAYWRVYGILPTFVPGPKHPLANKLFDMFGVNHGAKRLWLLRRHRFTMLST
jgi:hypothetical protein